ncbi:hypothetical protein NQ318_015670, partial [Aromia moschata]
MKSCGMNFIKYLLFIFNLIFAISGLGILIAGALVISDVSEFNHFIDGGLLGPPIVLIVAGAIVFVIAFLGCFGAIKESYNMLISVTTDGNQVLCETGEDSCGNHSNVEEGFRRRLSFGQANFPVAQRASQKVGKMSTMFYENRAGWPSTSSSDDDMKRLRNLLNTDRCLSVRLISETLDITKTIVNEIVSESLGMRNVCAKLVPKFAVLLAIIFIIELAVGIAAAVYKSDFHHALNGTLRKSLENYSNDNDRIAWDNVQKKLMCCGINGPNDWEEKNIAIPFSCCHNNDNIDKEPDSYCIDSGTGKYRFKIGCYEQLKMKINSNAKILIGVGIGIAFIE